MRTYPSDTLSEGFRPSNYKFFGNKFVIGLVSVIVVVIVAGVAGLIYGIVTHISTTSEENDDVSSSSHKPPNLEAAKPEVSGTKSPPKFTLPPLSKDPYFLESGCSLQYTVESCISTLKCDKKNGKMQCPKVTERSEVTLECFGKQVTFQSDKKCECADCPNQSPKKRIAGKVKSADGNPVKYVKINIGEQYVGSTSSAGKYSIDVDVPESGSIVLIFSKDSFMQTTKVVDVSGSSVKIDFDATLVSVKKTIAFDVTEEATLDFGEDSASAFASILIPANSVVDKDGNAVSGEVTISTSYMDPKNDDDLALVPDTFESTEGPLLSEGMFIIDIKCNGGQECALTNAEITPQTNTVENLVLWVLNGTKWERVSSPSTSRRKRREAILFENVRIESNWYNLDFLWQYCYLKVIAYNSNSLERSNVIKRGVKARAMFLTGESPNIRWLGFYEAWPDWYTGNLCLQVPCDDTSLITKIQINAIYRGHQLFPVKSNEVSFDVEDMEYTPLENSFSIQPKFKEIKPPLYEAYNWTHNCFDSEYGENHIPIWGDISFSDINYVPFDEDSFQIPHYIQENPRVWWANDNNINACYIKVQIVKSDWSGPLKDEYIISSENYGGVQEEIKDKYIGTRFEKIKNNNGVYVGCVEYKCSDHISTLNNAIDQTLVKIKVEDKYDACYLSGVNENLAEKLKAQKDPYVEYYPYRTFEMYAGKEDFGFESGVYFDVSSSAPVSEVKENAYKKCMAGRSVRVIEELEEVNIDHVALNFTCTWQTWYEE